MKNKWITTSFVFLLGFYTQLSGQLHVPLPVLNNTTTQNIGVDISTPGAKLEILHPNDFIMNPDDGTRSYFPGIRLTSTSGGVGNPLEFYRLKDGISVPSSFNVPFLNTSEVDPIFILHGSGELSVGGARREGFLTLHNGNFENSGFVQNDMIVFSYENQNGFPVSYNRFGNTDGGNAYWAFNSRLLQGNWQIDLGSYEAKGLRVIQGEINGKTGAYFQSYKHPNHSPSQGLNNWTPFQGNWLTNLYVGSDADDNPKVQIGRQTIQDGTTHEDFRVSVDGKLVAREIIVTDGTEWGDFVFEENYPLMSLNELEFFINENQHLPDIPSAIEVEEKGVDLRMMITKQMIKIEELTLHIIELNKKIQKLEELKLVEKQKQ